MKITYIADDEVRFGPVQGVCLFPLGGSTAVENCVIPAYQFSELMVRFIDWQIVLVPGCDRKYSMMPNNK